MGIKNGRNKLIQLKVPVKHLSMDQLLALEKPLHLDLFGAFFVQLRDAPLTLAKTLKDLNGKNNLTVWIDGARTQEKLETHHARTLAKITALKK
jgi:hypothetical protein